MKAIPISATKMNVNYERDGYFVIKQLFQKDELVEVRNTLLEFHQLWKQDNKEFYLEKAVNSAYLTANQYLSNEKREILFRFIGSSKIMDVLTSTLSTKPMFMNTQLFFNPHNENLKNYWHRDPQYHLSIEDLKKALDGPNALHFRIPLVDEPGIELVPCTHKRWDSDEEFAVRTEQNGLKNNEQISTGVKIPLKSGDLLVFSANMIHRGLYGMDRFALDICFADTDADLAKFVQNDCLPDEQMLANIEDARAFSNTIRLKTNQSAQTH